MNLKIITKTENEAVIEFVGEGHTILNLLRTELLNDERVLMATYDTKFPVMDNPVFRITTSGNHDGPHVGHHRTMVKLEPAYSREGSETLRWAVIRPPKRISINPSRCSGCAKVSIAAPSLRGR